MTCCPLLRQPDGISCSPPVETNPREVITIDITQTAAATWRYEYHRTCASLTYLFAPFITAAHQIVRAFGLRAKRAWVRDDVSRS
ncbi:hypothetical protein KEM60_02407 [Austwickia sp. TVS 96-490-7B]|nr:hypothetical protein [Austwickia sp. TVS 96-490-7B]